MFQIEQALEAWKIRIGQSEAIRPIDLAELEQHVRDSVAHLVTTGLSDEEAFLVAIHRVGEPNQIASEFKQVNGAHIWGQRVFWMIAGFLFFGLCGLVIHSIALSSQAITALVGGSGNSMGMMASIVSALCWLGLIIAIHQWTHKQREAATLQELLSRQHVRTLSFVAGAAVVLSAVLTFIGRVGVARYAQVTELGKSSLIWAVTNELLEFLVPAAFIFVLWQLQRMLQGTAISEQ
jgi:hypothetical protein